MDRVNSFNGMMPPTAGHSAAKGKAAREITHETGSKAANNAGNKCRPAAGGTELSSPTLSTRPKLTRQRVYGDVDGRDDPPGHAGSPTSSRRKNFHASVARAHPSGFRNATRLSFADLPKSYPVVKKWRSPQAAETGHGHPVSAQFQGNGPLPGSLAWRKEGKIVSVTLNGKDDLHGLVAILAKAPEVDTLKIACDFGGKSGSINIGLHDLVSRMAGLDICAADPLDEASFRTLLSSLTKIRSLDLRGCRLSDQNFMDLASFIQQDTTLQTLALGKRDIISLASQEAFGAALAANATLRELVLDGLVLETKSVMLAIFSADEAHVQVNPIIEGIQCNQGLMSVKLCNLQNSEYLGPVFGFQHAAGLFGRQSPLREVSFAGTSLAGAARSNTTDETLIRMLLISARDIPPFMFRKLTPPNAPSFSFGEQLLQLDLSDCSLTQEQTHSLVRSLPIGAGLMNLKLDGNEMLASDENELKYKLARNRARLLEEGSHAYHALITRSANAPSHWSHDLSSLLAAHTPSEDLLSLSEVWEDMQDPSDSSSEDGVILTTEATGTATTTTTTTVTTSTMATTATTTTRTTARERDPRASADN